MVFRSSIAWIHRLAALALVAATALGFIPLPVEADATIAAVLTDFPPLYQSDSEGHPAGFAVDILQTVSRDANLELRYLPVRNWAEAMSAVRSGQADLVPAIGISQPRTGEFIFSSEIETVPVSWFVRRDSGNLSSVADLQGRPVAVIAESAAATRLQAEGSYRLVPHETLESALFALLAGNVDALVFPKPVLEKKAREIDLEDRIRVIGEPLMELKRGFMFRAGDTALRDRLEPHIQAYTRSEAYLENYRKWYGKPTPFWTTPRVFWGMLTLAAVSLFGMMASRYMAIARLNGKLRESEEKHRTYVENAPEGIFVADHGGRYLDINPSACAMTGYSRDELLTMSIADLAPSDLLPEHLDLFDAVKRQGTLAMELSLRRKDGRLVDTIIQAIVLPNNRVMGFCSDITERKRQELDIAKVRNQLQATLDAVPDLLFELDRDGRYINYHSPRDDLLAAPADRFLGRTVTEILPPAAAQACMAALGEAEEKDHTMGQEFALDLDTGRHWFELSVSRKRAIAGEATRFIVMSRDITERKLADDALRNSEERLRLALDAANQAWFEVDLRSGKVAVSPEYPRMIGYDPEQFASDLGTWKAKIHPDDRQALDGALTACLRDGGPHTMDYRRHTASNTWKWMRSVGKIVQWDEAGRAIRMVGIHTDITQIKEHERQLEHIAHYDALTGLPNRLLLADRLHQAMVQAQRRGLRLAVAYLDLDGFKTINDSHGHDAGDRLLSVLAERMKHALREGDTLARLGGDEFVAVLLDLADVEACVPMLTRLLAASAEVVHDKGLALHVSASLGVSFYPQVDEVDADQLLRQADQAMYQAKLAGKNRFHIFDTEHDRTVRGHQESLERIRLGLVEGEFLLHYQPKINMRTGQVLGAEALLRWLHPQRGMLPPALFLPVIEGHPLSIQLGEWVLDTALAQAEAWKSAGLALSVSVNVDAAQLQSPLFVDRLRQLLEDHPGIGSGDLELEVLEANALGDINQVSRVIEACRDIGVGFALDDFGAGYSSLTYLKRLPASLLKIDQSFVRNMLDDPDDLAILESILGLAKAFRRQTIAEGVETVAHGSMLLRLGCELGQGHAIARPMPAAEMPAWLADWESPHAWKFLSPMNHDRLPMLFAAVELQAWILALNDFLVGNREFPPPPGLGKLGEWLDHPERSASPPHPAQPDFPATEVLHREFHLLAREITELDQQGRSREIQSKMDMLRVLKDRLLECI